MIYLVWLACGCSTPAKVTDKPVLESEAENIYRLIID